MPRANRKMKKGTTTEKFTNVDVTDPGKKRGMAFELWRDLVVSGKSNVLVPYVQGKNQEIMGGKHTEQLSSQLRDKRAELMALKKELWDFHKEFKLAKKDVDKQKSKGKGKTSRKHSDELSKWKKRLNAREDALRAKEAELAELKRELFKNHKQTKSKKQGGVSRSKLAMLVTKEGELSKHVKEFTTKCRDLQMLIEMRETDLKRLNREHDVLDRELGTSRKEWVVLKEKLSGGRDELNGLKLRLSEKMKALGSVEKEHRRRLRSLEKDIAAKNKELTALLGEDLDPLRKEIKMLRDECVSLRHQNAGFGKEVVSLKAKKKKLQADIDTLDGKQNEEFSLLHEIRASIADLYHEQEALKLRVREGKRESKKQEALQREGQHVLEFLEKKKESIENAIVNETESLREMRAEIKKSRGELSVEKKELRLQSDRLDKERKTLERDSLRIKKLEESVLNREKRLHDDVEQADSRLKTVQTELSSNKEESKILSVDISAKQKELANVGNELKEALRQGEEELSRKRKEQQQTLAGLETEIKVRESALEHLKEEADSLVSGVAQLKKEESELEGSSLALAERHKETLAEVDKARAELVNIKEELKERRRSLGEVELALGEERSQVKEREHELLRMERKLETRTRKIVDMLIGNFRECVNEHDSQGMHHTYNQLSKLYIELSGEMRTYTYSQLLELKRLLSS